MSNPSSSEVLSSIKQIGESSLAGSGVRGLGVDNLEEAHVGFYNTHRRVILTQRNHRKSGGPRVFE